MPSSPTPSPNNLPSDLPSPGTANDADLPLTANDIKTPEQLASLKEKHAQLTAEYSAAEAACKAAREKRESKPGYNPMDTFLLNRDEDDKAMEVLCELGKLKLPHPQPLQWALTELSVDFKRAHHQGTQLNKFTVEEGREWYDDDGHLISRLETYILMRFGASKHVINGVTTFMPLQAVHNLWTMCRHLINHYDSLSRYEKGQATKAFTSARVGFFRDLPQLTSLLTLKYKLTKSTGIILPGISELPPWTDFWYNFPENPSLFELCGFDLSCDINSGESKIANVSDGKMVINCSLAGQTVTQTVTWEPNEVDNGEEGGHEAPAAAQSSTKNTN